MKHMLFDIVICAYVAMCSICFDILITELLFSVLFPANCSD